MLDPRTDVEAVAATLARIHDDAVLGAQRTAHAIMKARDEDRDPSEAVVGAMKRNMATAELIKVVLTCLHNEIDFDELLSSLGYEIETSPLRPGSPLVPGGSTLDDELGKLLSGGDASQEG